MIEPTHRSPARLSASSVTALPRWLLLPLLLAFLLTGLVGRSLWLTDAESFGRMWTMAHGDAAAWLLPGVAGAPTPQGGPLADWSGALALRLLGPLLGEPAAAAASIIGWSLAAAAALWFATLRLARREEAQPLAPVFGNEARRGDYARAVADIALLLFIGTIGMAPRLHEVQADAAAIALVSLALFALTAFEWRRLPAALAVGVAVGGLALTEGPLPALGLLGGCAAAMAGTFRPLRAGALAALGATLGALALWLAWPLLARVVAPGEAPGWFDAWLAWAASTPGWPEGTDALWLVRNATWFTWPLWPLAGWAVYAWRNDLMRAHLAQPLLVLAGLAVAMLASSPLREPALALLVPPLVLVAAFGATSLRRALQNLVDWFSIAVFSLMALFVWAYFLAATLGFPRAMAASVDRLAFHHAQAPPALALLLALAASALWLALVRWRVGHRPHVLWRGPLLSAGGVTMFWLVAHALFLPRADFIFSFQPLSQEIADALRQRAGAGDCVQAEHVPLAERALIAYYGGVHFEHAGGPACRFALQREDARFPLAGGTPAGASGSWQAVWQTRRRTRPEETWRLWQQ